MTTKTLKEKPVKQVSGHETPVKVKHDIPFMYRPLYLFPIPVCILMVLFGALAFSGIAIYGGMLYARHHTQVIDQTETLNRNFIATFNFLENRLRRVEDGRSLVDEKMSPCAHLEQLTSTVNDLSNTVKILSSEIETLQEGTIEVILSSIGKMETAVEKNSELTTDLDKRLANLEERTVKPETILALMGRIEEVQSDLHKRFRERQHFALLSAVTLLKEAMVSGRPYELEVLTARSLANEDSFVLQKISVILPYAARGVLSEPAILSAFDAALVAPAEPEPEVDPATINLFSKIKAKLSTLVSIKRKPSQKANVQIEIVRTQFKKYMERGDFQTAALSLNMLPDVYAKRLTDAGFFAELQRYIAVRTAMKDLLSYTYAAIAADRLDP